MKKDPEVQAALQAFAAQLRALERNGLWHRLREPLGMVALVAAGVGGFALGGYAGITIRLLWLLDAAAVAALRVLL